MVRWSCRKPLEGLACHMTKSDLVETVNLCPQILRLTTIEVLADEDCS